MDRPGFYLDIGAHDPEYLSLTWALDYCLGWKGVCVEPAPELAKKFPGTGRTCTVVESAVSLRTGRGQFVGSGSVAGSVSKEGSALNASDATSVSVELANMTDILAQAGVPDGQMVNFLNIDVEGNELEALVSYPFTRNPVAFASVENVAGTKDTQEFLFDSGFVSLGENGVDTLWASIPKPWLPKYLAFTRKGHAEMRENVFNIRQYDTKALRDHGWFAVLEAVAVNRTLEVVNPSPPDPPE